MGFNLAAFLVSLLWVGYRKMYGMVAILAIVIYVETVLEYVYFVGHLGMPEPPNILSGLVAIVIGAICGVCGNRWYFTHTKKVITDVRHKETEAEARKAALTKRGGTSWFGSLFAIVLITLGFVPVVFVLVLLDLIQV